MNAPTSEPIPGVPPKPAPRMTAYGMAARPDPLTYSYVMTQGADGLARKPGTAFRDPTNGKVYVVDEHGSLRRAHVVKGPDGQVFAEIQTRESRRRTHGRSPAR